MDFNYVVVPAIVVLALVLMACVAVRRIITLQRGEHSRARRRKEVFILWLIAFFCIAVAALAAFAGHRTRFDVTTRPSTRAAVIW